MKETEEGRKEKMGEDIRKEKNREIHEVTRTREGNKDTKKEGNKEREEGKNGWENQRKERT